MDPRGEKRSLGLLRHVLAAPSGFPRGAEYLKKQYAMLKSPKNLLKGRVMQDDWIINLPLQLGECYGKLGKHKTAMK